MSSELISSNLHRSQLENRCWTVVLNFNNGLACDSFVCETLFSQTCQFYASREKSRRRTFARRASLRIWSRNPFPISLHEYSRTSGACWRESFLSTAFIDMDDITTSWCILLSPLPNWCGSRCYTPGYMPHILLLLVKNFWVKNMTVNFSLGFSAFIFSNDMYRCML